MWGTQRIPAILRAVDAATMVTAFATIFLAELPDKTMLATIVLSSRFRRPGAVWVGAAAALSVQMVIATTAGRLLSELPQRPVRFAVAALFAIGAIVLWRSRDHAADENDQIADDLDGGDNPIAHRAATLPGRRIAATVFGIVFVAEWGDLTQLTTASLAAKGEAVSVLLGATAAMVSVAAIGVLAGRTLLRVVPAKVLHRVAAVVFAVLAVVFVVDAVRTVDVDTGGDDPAFSAIPITASVFSMTTERASREELHSAVAVRLREVDQRYTSGRRALVDLLADASRPATIPELLDGRPTLAQSSVYRNLVVLEEVGVAHRVVTSDERARYELAEDLMGHHHHMICTTCGRVDDFTVSAQMERSLRTALDRAVEGTGFRPDAHRLDLVGVCSACD